ncbi:MAG: hypothetical protein IK079_04315, partial [Desulfovibrio sp.]|nr:hypothetical protein [Desulfovibrio sp.]
KSRKYIITIYKLFIPLACRKERKICAECPLSVFAKQVVDRIENRNEINIHFKKNIEKIEDQTYRDESFSSRYIH